MKTAKAEILDLYSKGAEEFNLQRALGMANMAGTPVWSSKGVTTYCAGDLR